MNFHGEVGPFQSVTGSFALKLNMLLKVKIDLEYTYIYMYITLYNCNI